VKRTSYDAPHCSHLQPPATSSLLDPNILLSTLFSDTLNLCSSLSVRDQYLYPYKTRGKIVSYILIFKFTHAHEQSSSFLLLDYEAYIGCGMMQAEYGSF